MWPCSDSMIRGPFQHACSMSLVCVNATGKPLTDNEIEDSFARHASDSTFDFGFLDETAQAEVLRNLASGNERLNLPISLSTPDTDVMTGNQEIIGKNYGLESYGRQLEGIYDCLLKAGSGSPAGADADKILSAFLDTARFTFLRS